MTHIPAGKDGERVTARSKGKVERPFRTTVFVFQNLLKAAQCDRLAATDNTAEGDQL
jgi:hypothetical protein